MSPLTLLTSAPALLAALPVVDIDATIFIQGGIFIALVLVLKPVLFTPWLEAQAKRVASIDGAFDKAKSLRTEADELSSDYDAKLAIARDEALTMRSHMRREEEAAQAKTLANARALAGKELDDNRVRIAAETDKARQALGDKVDELANQITEKVLGRAS
ncbi:MAG: ATP synthase F0 subunit B [Nannocystaceae bacterium]|nr:ATP synthase F0 subunit B [Nannocystaceae bacterium]